MENRGMNEPCGLSLIDAIDNGRKNNSWYLSGFVSAVRRILVAFGVCLVMAGCVGVGQGYKEHVDNDFRGLGFEMDVALNWVFRPSLSSMRSLASAEYGDPKRYAYYRNATIPAGHAHVNGRDMCDRRNNPYCKGLTFGEELLARPDVIDAMTDWLTHLCERLPVVVTDPVYYSDVKYRQRKIDTLRSFLACGSKIPDTRDIRIHIYIVRDFDNVFRRYPPEHTDAVLQQSVIRDWVFKINSIRTAKVK